MATLKAVLLELVEAVEECGCIPDIEGGQELEGPYAQACKKLKRKPRWPAGFADEETNDDYDPARDM